MPSSQKPSPAKAGKQASVESTPTEETAMETEVQAGTSGETAPALSNTESLLVLFEHSLEANMNVNPVNLPADNEEELMEGVSVSVNPKPKPTVPSGGESGNENDDFVNTAAASHRGKMNLKKKEDKKKAAPEKAAEEQKQQADAADSELKDPEKTEVQSQAKQMVFCMAAHELKCQTISELQKHAVPRVPKKNDPEPPDSGDDDDEIMNSYPCWYGELSDLSQWTPLKSNTGKQRFTNQNKHKLDIACSIWEEGERCSFICCRVPQWNPAGVCVYHT